MKLYVWEHVLTDYTSGVMFALAESLPEARKLVRDGYKPDSQVWKDSAAKPRVFTKRIGYRVWGGG